MLFVNVVAVSAVESIYVKAMFRVFFFFFFNFYFNVCLNYPAQCAYVLMLLLPCCILWDHIDLLITPSSPSYSPLAPYPFFKKMH